MKFDGMNKEFQTFYLHSSQYEEFSSQMSNGTIFRVYTLLHNYVTLAMGGHNLQDYIAFTARLKPTEEIYSYWLTNDVRRATLKLLAK